MTTSHPAARPDAATESVASAAERLKRAAADGAPCPPVRDLIGSDDVAAAYAVQERVNATRRDAGVPVVGRKIGLTSPAVQLQLGVDQPDFGVLFADMDRTVPAGETATAPLERLLQPKIEAEIAFVLGCDLDDGELDDAQVRAAVAEVRPALEIVDSRIEGWDISFADTVADNGSSALFVLGDAASSLEDFTPVSAQMSMRHNGEEVSAGSGDACLGDPLNALAWLARTAREFGDPLRAGQIVLSGALGPMVAVTGPGIFTAQISDLGSVTVAFIQEDHS